MRASTILLLFAGEQPSSKLIAIIGLAGSTCEITSGSSATVPEPVVTADFVPAADTAASSTKKSIVDSAVSI